MSLDDDSEATRPSLSSDLKPARQVQQVAAVMLVLAVCATSAIASTYLWFPYGRLADYITQTIERPRDATGKRRPSGWRVAIGSLSPSWIPGGATLERVRVARPSPEGRPAVALSLDEVSARFHLWRTLFGTQALSFSAKVKGGTALGSFAQTSTMTALQVALDNVPLQLGRVAEAATGIAIAGTLSGDLDLTLHDNEQETSGRGTFRATNVTLGSDTLTVPFGGMSLRLPALEAGTVSLAFVVQHGVGTIETLRGDGRDVALLGKGTIALRRPLSRSRPQEVLLRITPKDAYREKNDLTRAAFEALQFPMARPYRTASGDLQISLGGSSFQTLRITPAGAQSF